MAKGKTRENKEFSKKTGFFEAEVVAVNPTKEQLSKLLNTELEGDEIEYTSSEEVEGKQVGGVQVVFWLRSLEDPAYIKPVRFFLRDQERMNVLTEEEIKEGTKVRKKQYINTIGVTSWTDNVENLPEWFTQRSFRVAKVGEAELYTFIAAWLNKLDRKDPDAALLADFKKLISGDVKEIRSEIGGTYAGTVLPLVTIRTVKKEGEETKEYEQVYNRDMLPGFVAKQLRTKTVDDEFIKRAKVTDRNKRSQLQKFILGITDGMYGIKEDHYSVGFLEEYDPSKNPRASGKVLTEEDTDY